MRNPTGLLRMLLGFASGYHILLGLAVMLFKPHAPELARMFFKFNLPPTPEVLWMLNPFSAYLLAFGLMLAVAARDPVRHRPVVFAAVALFLLRALQRGLFLASAPPELAAVASPVQGFFHLAVVTIMGIAMLVLALRIKPPEPGA